MKPLRPAVALATTLICAVGAAVAPAAASQADTVPAPARSAPPLTPAELRRELDAVLKEGGYVSATMKLRDGRHRVLARAGEARLGTGRPVPRDARFRTGSTTKALVSTVVLQLAAEGRISLDDTVERWLPGVVEGNGNDGRRVTIRNLLQHTSGLHNYSSDFGVSTADFEKRRYQHSEPRALVADAMRHEPSFPPAPSGDPNPDWEYSNTNYLLAGMIIKKVTGRSWAAEVRDRVLRPTGMLDTYAPGDDPRITGPHARAYEEFPDAPGVWVDTTEQNVTWADAAGGLVSTQADIDRFFTALLRGELLPPAQLAEMLGTVPANEDTQFAFPGLSYGLGLTRQPLSCGGYTWGHGGDIEGSITRVGFTEDGRRGVVASISGRRADDELLLKGEWAVQKLIDRALCGSAR